MDWDWRATVAHVLAFRRLDGNFSVVEPDTPELFFCRDLEGYGWCVRKEDYLNVGIGRREHEHFGTHVQSFMSFLARTGRVPRAMPAGHGVGGRSQSRSTENCR